jgi:hypothetical protein
MCVHQLFRSSHNFYVMLTGQKRFVLFPPSSEVYLYPFLHPHASKSQINVLSSRSCRQFPNFDPSKGETFLMLFVQKNFLFVLGFDVTITAGDVLYIPPFWYHDVSTELPSMSVAVWSPSRDDGISDALIGLGLPISDRSAALRKQLRIVFLWIAVLLESGFDGEQDLVKSFVQDSLVDGRFRFVGRELGLDKEWMSENCPG